MATQRQQKKGVGRRTVKQKAGTGEGRRRSRPAREIIIQLDGEVEDLFTLERTTADVGNVFVSAETNPEHGRVSSPNVAIVQLSSTGFRFFNEPTDNAIEFEADRESLYALGVALLRVANRVQHRHAQPRMA